MIFFSIVIKTLAKRKLEIDEKKNITVYTEADGTEIDSDTFSELESGSIFICADENETWLPEVPQEERVAETASSTMEVKTSQSSESISITHSAEISAGKYINMKTWTKNYIFHLKVLN